jgi:hypothetical protein
MHTLIPEQLARFLKNEYRIRVVILLLLFMSLGIWFGIVSLFPSYIISVTQERGALNQADAIEKSAESTTTTAALAAITTSNGLIKTLEASQDTLMLSSIVEDIAVRRIPGITINDFEIGRADATSTNIVIQGTATTRDILVNFENNLKADSRFSKVDLPVSDLAKNSDITFSMSITGIR